VYSDVGFIILGDLVQKVSGMTLSEFKRQKIFRPLGMNETGYEVKSHNRDRCAPTAEDKKCIPHDPKALFMYPHALGHAGVFSTIGNLSRLAQLFLQKGIYHGKRILKEVSVRKMSMLYPGEVRGMGFDLLSPYANPPRGEVFPKGLSYGHTGFTGTTFWIDPQTQTYYIFLSNRVYLGESHTGKAFTELRRTLATLIGESIYRDFNRLNSNAAKETATTEMKTK
ncbi:MAG: serine hydrolase, partial [Bacteriovoracaceae bacterium]